MRGEDWKKAMQHEAESVDDPNWAHETRQVAQRLGVWEWLAPLTGLVLIAALTVLVVPETNPGGWGINTGQVYVWLGAEQLAVLAAMFGLFFGLAFGLARLGVRSWVIAATFAAYPLILALLGAVFFWPDLPIVYCLQKAWTGTCLAFDVYLQPIRFTVWDLLVAGISVLIAAAGTSAARVRRIHP